MNTLCPLLMISMRLLAAMSLWLMSSCVTSFDIVEAVSAVAERTGDPEPESEWNSTHLWRRVSDNPPTYIPSAYAVSAPRTENEGSWFEDKRDGKRIFAPKTKVGKYEPGVLSGEAKKITNWTRRQYTFTSPGIIMMP